MNSKITFCIAAILSISTLLLSAADKGGKKSKSSISYEVTGDASYVGGVKTRIGDVKIGDVTEQSTSLGIVQSREISEGTLLRLGAASQRFSFGLPNAAPLPNTLQSVNAVIGADLEVGDSWLMRVETYPGVYSDFKDIAGDDFNSPFIVGATYLQSEDFQWFVGMSVNAKRDIPVLPGAGFRWHFADQWTLMALFPKPRIEYQLNDAITLYGGGELKGDTYTVSQDFGSNHGRPVLNGAELDYSEGRIGVGASWKLCPAVTVEAEAGALVYRDFDFHDAKQSFHEDSVAPYGQLAIKAGF